MPGKEIAKEYENWVRIVTLIHHGGHQICQDILHQQEGLPVDGGQLYIALSAKFADFQKLLHHKKVIKQNQFDVIFPPNRITDISQFDITLFTSVITVMFGGQKYKLLVEELRKWRNEEFHKGKVKLTAAEFNVKWNNIIQLFANHGLNVTTVADLKICALDKQSQYQNAILEAKVFKTEVQQMRQTDDASKSKLVTIVGFALISILLGYLYYKEVFSTRTGDTTELRNAASEMLKKHYIETIGKENMNSIHENYRPKKRFYVELAVVPKAETDKELKIADRVFHVTQTLHRKGTVTIDQLLQSKDSNMILLQGAGGVGKSYMLETAALHWAEGKIWQDIQFLFLLKFRELNLFKEHSFQESLETIYKAVYSKIKFNDLHEVGERVLFLMDGIDEFASLNETLAKPLLHCNDSSVATGFRNLIEPHCFPGRKLIITGRVLGFELLRSSFNTLSIDSFEVLGFTEAQVNQYVDTYIATNTTAAQGLKDFISQSEKLKLMSRIPAFLWSLCELHLETGSFTEMATMTELYAWQLTVFLRQHYRSLNESLSFSSPMDIYKTKEVRKLVFGLAKIAKTTLSNSKALMDMELFQADPNFKVLEKSGIVTRVRTNFGEKLQFNHMLLQEFLTAIFYLDTENDDNELLKDKTLITCAHLYSGLVGALLSKSNSSKDLQVFVKNLGVNERLSLLSFPDRAMSTVISPILEIIFEYQNELSPPVVRECETNEFYKLLIDYSSGLRKTLYGLGIKPPERYLDIFQEPMLCEKFRKPHFFESLSKKFTNITNFESSEIYFKQCLETVFEFLSDSPIFLNFISDFKSDFNSIKFHCQSEIVRYHLIMKELTTVIDTTKLLSDDSKILTIKALEQLVTIKPVPPFCYDKSYGISEFYCKSNSDPDLSTSCHLFNQITLTYKTIKSLAEVERKLNASITEKCNQPINYCGRHGLNLQQNETSYGDTNLVYFFKNFGHLLRSHVKLLVLKKQIPLDEAKIISPHLCDISNLRINNSFSYEMDTLSFMIKTIINCPDNSSLEKLVLDYHHKNRNVDFIKVNEMGLKYINKIETMQIRVHSNLCRAMELLNSNIQNHKNLSSFKLKHLTIYTKTFNAKACRTMIEFLPNIKTLKIFPFNIYLYPETPLIFCKNAITKELQQKQGKFQNLISVVIQNWKLQKGSGYTWEWVMDNEFQFQGRKEVVLTDDTIEAISKILFYNFILIFFAYGLIGGTSVVKRIKKVAGRPFSLDSAAFIVGNLCIITILLLTCLILILLALDSQQEFVIASEIYIADGQSKTLFYNILLWLIALIMLILFSELVELEELNL